MTSFFNTLSEGWIDRKKSLTMTNLTSIHSELWPIILSNLRPNDVQNLLLVNRRIKSVLQNHLYHELTFTEWASSGTQLALAIYRGIVSNETCECVKRLKFQFTSIEEISETLKLVLQIQPRLPNVHSISVEGHSTEDCVAAIKLLVQQFKNCDSISMVSRFPSLTPLESGPKILPLITMLKVPRLFRHELSYLSRVSDVELEEVTEDGSGISSVGSQAAVFDRLALPYSWYKDLGSPPAMHLELTLQPVDSVVEVVDATCTVLRLVATMDLPRIVPRLHTPSLRALILCNIAPLPTTILFENNSLNTVEFISIAPVTLPALRSLANLKHLPSLRLLLAMVMRATFLSEPFLQKREARKVVEWLQMIAARYPVDVRDFSWLLRQDIYFSDGLWCLAAQTRYKKYLPLVAPPPLKHQ